MKASVLLINPKVSEASQNIRIKALVNITFPTSLGVLAGYLMHEGIEPVQIIDEQIYSLADKDLYDAILSLKEPRIIGISVLTINCGRAYELSKKIKEIDPLAKVVLGGIHPTVVPEEVLCQRGVDIVVRGEGEETFQQLSRSIIDDKEYKKISGISYKENGRIVHNSDRTLIQDLDKIPPFPYYLFEKEIGKYPTFGGVIGSRGCPYNCSFCSSRNISGRNYRHHSIGRVIGEIKTLVRKYNQESVHLMDDNIAVDKKHFKALCKEIIREGLNKEAFFQGSLRGDNATEDILDMAYEANFKILYYGLETGSEELMKILNKGETVSAVEDAIKRSAQKGFSVGTTIIFGLPSEKRKDRYETIKFVRSLPLSSARFNTLSPYPGTPVFEKEYPKGTIVIKENWKNFGVQYMWESDDIPYVPEGNDRVQLIFDTMWANVSFYFSFKGLKKWFTEKYAGGNVIKLSNKWYLSGSDIHKMSRAFFYLILRFSNIAGRMFLKRILKIFSK